MQPEVASLFEQGEFVWGRPVCWCSTWPLHYNPFGPNFHNCLQIYHVYLRELAFMATTGRSSRKRAAPEPEPEPLCSEDSRGMIVDLLYHIYCFCIQFSSHFGQLLRMGRVCIELYKVTINLNKKILIDWSAASNFKRVGKPTCLGTVNPRTRTVLQTTTRRRPSWRWQVCEEHQNLLCMPWCPSVGCVKTHQHVCSRRAWLALHSKTCK